MSTPGTRCEGMIIYDMSGYTDACGGFHVQVRRVFSGTFLKGPLLLGNSVSRLNASQIPRCPFIPNLCILRCLFFLLLNSGRPEIRSRTDYVVSSGLYVAMLSIKGHL